MKNKERLHEGKKRNFKTKIVAPALAWILMLSSTATAQQWNKIESKRENNKEIFSNTKEKISDTTIDYNTAKLLNNNETEEITTEEIKEFIINNKDEIMRIMDETTKEKVYDALIHNVGVHYLIKKLIHDEEIRAAAQKWDDALIQKKVNDAILKEIWLGADNSLIGGVGLIIWMILSYFICKKADKDYEKEKENEGRLNPEA